MTPRATYALKHTSRTARIEHELSVITTLGYADYFLMVWDIVLDGAFAAKFALRKPYIMEGLGKLDPDVICIANACAREDKDAAIAAEIERMLYGNTRGSSCFSGGRR